MSSFSRRSYEQAAQQFFQQNPRLFEKYFAPTLLQTLVDGMLSSLPTTTTAKIVFDRLVANGSIPRTDRKTERDDRAEAVAVAQANLDKAVAEVDSKPLSRSELEYFGSLSQRELSRLYYGEDGDAINEFAVRYRKAHREHSFILPPRFSDIKATAASASSEEFELTPAQYHALPAAELQRRLREPRFKLRVMQMMKAGQI
jgi:hypothetical protein